MRERLRKTKVAADIKRRRPFIVNSQMGNVLPHEKVKLIIGFIFNDADILRKAESLITKKYGPIDLKSGVMGFRHTDYYNEELGDGLKREFISIKKLISPEGVYRVKLATNKIERRLSDHGKRTINIDPGYLTPGKLVLLTTKDHSHRIYLKKGIYAESTLKFQSGTYARWDTTFPDYRSNDYIRLFNEMRTVYRGQLKKQTRNKSAG